MKQSHRIKLADSTASATIRFGEWWRILPMLTTGWVIQADEALMSQGWLNCDGAQHGNLRALAQAGGH